MKVRYSLGLLILTSVSVSNAIGQNRNPVPPPPTSDEPVVTSRPLTPELLPPGQVISAPQRTERVATAPAPATPIRLPSQPLTAVDAVVLSHNHVSDQVLLKLIQQYGVARPLTAVDVNTLRNEGVSNIVIIAMQQAPSPPVYAPAPAAPPPVVMAPAPVYVPAVVPPPVIIHEYRYAPRPVYGYYAYPPPRHHGPRYGITIYGR